MEHCKASGCFSIIGGKLGMEAHRIADFVFGLALERETEAKSSRFQVCILYSCNFLPKHRSKFIVGFTGATYTPDYQSQGDCSETFLFERASSGRDGAKVSIPSHAHSLFTSLMLR